MKFLKNFALIIAVSLLSVGLQAQHFGPKVIKSFESKDFKGRSLLVLPIDKFPVKNKDMSVFKEFKTDAKVEREWKRRVEAAIAASTFDFFEVQVKDFYLEDMKKTKDKAVALLYFDKDHYDNYYAEIAVVEPKYQILACVPINGLTLTDSSNLVLMFNLLQYQLVINSAYFGNNAKPLYRGHENKYQSDIREFSDRVRSKSFLFAKYDKEIKNFAKRNEKMNTFMKMNWKLTLYEMVTQKDLEQRIQTKFNGMYMKPIYIYTDNPKITYNYNVFLNGNTGSVLFVHQTNGLISPASFKYVEKTMEEWLMANMDSKQLKEYTESKAKVMAPTPQKTTPKQPPAKQPQAKPAPTPAKKPEPKKK